MVVKKQFKFSKWNGFLLMRKPNYYETRIQLMMKTKFPKAFGWTLLETKFFLILARDELKNLIYSDRLVKIVEGNPDETKRAFGIGFYSSFSVDKIGMDEYLKYWYAEMVTSGTLTRFI
ncbi:hypothetical protein C1645_805771 [Glomus cerebriforme]|uniref:Uncharacterized protein n=1 Tax=Glomus cerebriforme TaxID=658196 RepID=A0A397T2B2_9GLOM|nr:hypothetical protein C1645_805771 [Glomus cerebriforme]